jgi:flagellar motor switch protein FliN/FliY
MMTGQNIDMLMGVSLDVCAELGRCTMRVRDVLQLGTGAVVELDRATEAPIDLLVNEKLVARGEIVAVNERFGVRITELLK